MHLRCKWHEWSAGMTGIDETIHRYIYTHTCARAIVYYILTVHIHINNNNNIYTHTYMYSYKCAYHHFQRRPGISGPYPDPYHGARVHSVGKPGASGARFLHVRIDRIALSFQHLSKPAVYPQMLRAYTPTLRVYVFSLQACTFFCVVNVHWSVSGYTLKVHVLDKERVLIRSNGDLQQVNPCFYHWLYIREVHGTGQASVAFCSN